MKLNFTVFVLAAIFLASFSKLEAVPVGETTAKLVGANFLNSQGMRVTTSDMQQVYTASIESADSSVSCYYVFNVAASHSFVIVSADNRLRPILAWSNESVFDVNHMSAAASDWVDGYRNRVGAAILHLVPAKSETAGQWSDLIAGRMAGKNERTTTVGPLLGSLIWNQEPYYNADCPGAGVYQAPTGCVATSMSQIMKYWNWPPVGTGYLQYECTTYSPAPFNLTADFGATAYNWSAMVNDVTSPNSYVAQLMSQVGIGVEMEYDTEESGAEVLALQTWRKSQCSEYALKTYFHYKRSLVGIPRNGTVYIGDSIGYVDSIAESDWISILQSELNAGRPVLYCGYGSVGGHAWVCDGYLPTGLFHFNWGWGGTGPNGYYSVDDLAPPSMGVGGGGNVNFDQDQGIIIGIQPDSFPNTPGTIQMASHLLCPISTPMPFGTPLTVSSSFTNSGTTDFNGDFCVQVFDTVNNLVGTVQTFTGATLAAGNTVSYTFGPLALFGMIPMDYYHLQAMYRETGTSTWIPVANNGNYINYTVADVADDTDIALYANIEVSSPLPIVSGGSLALTSKMYNQGTATFNGTVQAIMVSVTTGDTYPVQSLTGQVIDSNGYLSVSFANAAFTAPDGIYALMIQHQYDGTGSFHTTSSDYYENPILIPVGVTNSVKNATQKNDVYVFPNPSRDRINILPQGVTITGIQLLDLAGRVVCRQAVSAANSVVSLSVASLPAGVYIVRMQTDEGEMNKKVMVQ